MKKLVLAGLLIGIAHAAALGQSFAPESHPEAFFQFIDRIVRPCSTGAVTLASVVINPNNTGNIVATTCTGGSFTVNGSVVIPGGVACPGCTVGILPYFSAANTLANSPITRVNANAVTLTTIRLGTVSTSTGALQLANSSSAFLTTIVAGNAAAARTYTWPTNFGGGGSALVDAAGNGTLSWQGLTTGTVTSVATTSPITGGTITGTGTIACATCVTSAAALTANNLVIGAGSQASAAASTGTGVLTALGVNVGTAGAFVVNGGAVSGATYSTATNCADSAGAAACGSAAAGSFVIDAAATTVVVSTTAVTANSQIFVQEDSSLGTRLGITCNTQSILILGTPVITARTAGTSFTVAIVVGPTTTPMCLNYHMVN